MQPGQLNLLKFFQLRHYFLIGRFIPLYSLFQLTFYYFNAGNKLISIHNDGWSKINPKPLFHWQVLSLVTWNKGKFYHRISSVRMEVALLFLKSGQFCSNLKWWMMTARFIQLENFSCISTRGKKPSGREATAEVQRHKRKSPFRNDQMWKPLESRKARLELYRTSVGWR